MGRRARACSEKKCGNGRSNDGGNDEVVTRVRRLTLEMKTKTRKGRGKGNGGKGEHRGKGDTGSKGFQEAVEEERGTRELRRQGRRGRLEEESE